MLKEMKRMMKREEERERKQGGGERERLYRFVITADSSV
jgi:hypothetical protein